MKKWLTRYREIVIPALATVVSILVLGNLIKYKLLTASALGANKEALGALSSAVSIIAISLGAIFSYYRFFRGRTFYSRAELRIDVTVIPQKTGTNMHAIIVEVKNIGTLPIWNPSLVLAIVESGPDGERERVLDKWSEVKSPKGESGTAAVIDSGETAPFWTAIEVAESTWAVFYTAFVHSDAGEIWKRVSVVKNKVSDEKRAGTVQE